MIVIDSAGWIEFLADGPYADEFAARLRKPSAVLTPAIAVYEVYKWMKRQQTEESALAAVAAMKKTQIVGVTEEVALTAADLSLAHRLAMADSITLAVARLHSAELVTTDADFSDVDGVTVLRK